MRPSVNINVVFLFFFTNGILVKIHVETRDPSSLNALLRSAAINQHGNTITMKNNSVMDVNDITNHAAISFLVSRAAGARPADSRKCIVRGVYTVMTAGHKITDVDDDDDDDDDPLCVSVRSVRFATTRCKSSCWPSGIHYGFRGSRLQVFGTVEVEKRRCSLSRE